MPRVRKSGTVQLDVAAIVALVMETEGELPYKSHLVDVLVDAANKEKVLDYLKGQYPALSDLTLNRTEKTFTVSMTFNI